MTQQFIFKKATKEQLKARIALIGPSGSGKSYTALRLAEAFGGRVAVIDTENRSASLYADEFDFDTLALSSVSPQSYVKAIRAAEESGYDTLIIDSLSHAWIGKDGALAMVEKAKVRYSGNKWAAWREVTPHHNTLVDALAWCRCHLIVSVRSKTLYDVQKDDQGKVKPVKIGLAPVQRDGLEYEFDIVGDLDLDHNLVISKTRCKALDGQVIAKPGKELANTILDWLNAGAKPSPETPKREPPKEVVAPPKPSRVIESSAIFDKPEPKELQEPDSLITAAQEPGAPDKTRWEGIFDFPLAEYSGLPRQRKLGALSQAASKGVPRGEMRGWLQEHFGESVVGLNQLSDEQLVKAFQLLTG